MAFRIFEDHQRLSEAVALEIASQIKRKPQSVLCLAAGETPRLAYAHLADIAAREKFDFSRCTFIGLDEWLGIPPENEGSCFYFLRNNLFEPLNIAPDQINVFNGMTRNPEEECQRINAVIRVKGGIDLMVVGVGMNGHIGFNEPGVREDQHAHVIELDETTRTVGQKYFKESTLLQKGITLGFLDLLESRRVLMVASGLKKANIIRLALQGAISTDVPASIVRRHSNALAMLDRDAASALTQD